MEKKKTVFDRLWGCLGVGIILLLCILGQPLTGTASEQSLRNVMYYGDWSIEESQGVLYPKDIPAEKLTHLNFAFLDFDEEGQLQWTDEFAALKTPAGEEVVVEGSASAGLLNALQELRSRNSHLKIGVSVGGWTKSGDFAKNAQNDTYRKRLVSNLIKFVQYNEMDFLDIDWEYPGSVREPDLIDSAKDEGTPHASEKDRENFILLLTELKAGLNELSKETGKNYELSVALAAGPYTISQGTDIAGVFNVVDFANIMTYDIHGAWENATNHHSGLYTSPDAPQGNGKPWSFSIDDSVNYYLNNGAIAEKLVIGAAFYSRGWGNVENDGPDPVNQPGLFGTTDFATVDGDNNKSRGAENELPIVSGDGGRNGGIWSFRNLDKLKQKYPDLKEYWDDKSKAPYLYGETSKVFFTFDNERSLKEKANYVKEKNLGGMISWMQSQDAATTGTVRDQLTNAIFEGLFGQAALPSNELTAQELAVSATLAVRTNEHEGYILKLKNNEQLIETDSVLAAIEKNHKTIKNGLLTIESSRQETLKIGDYSLEPVEQQAKNEQALFRYQIDLKALGYNDIEPGQEIELVLTTDAPFADRATITDITLAQRIVSSVYGTQSIYKQQTPVENQGSVLFHFVDEEGNELEKTVEINDSVGQDFNYTVPEITGYQPLQKDYQGVFLNLKQEFVVVYQPQGVILPYEIGMVSVHYQDTEGKQLAEPKQMTGELGAAYETTPLSIEGYTLIETPKDAKGTYKKGEHQIIYVYQKTTIKPAGKNLPSTGEGQTKAAIWLGFTLLIVVLSIVIMRSKRVRQ
ncbi:glycosyl hydrolase family 18 protein [Enterococcus termitis]|uniref:chitinase n=1 Tax=Enterococcus termitis TaxID=332950 RepID=A0A1E5H7X1_9ENTE|nr:glycosyl hydrolase family 18 protein [Enterococcus termitis]OEG20750.1 hypothetical protein BCR25_02750 [Enterococcus termitis]OJG99669.1 hypothetical protein RV18_GL000008 [Enterococcus termitis]